MERNDGKIHIPARTKKYTNNNRAQIWISTEAYNALVDVYNESTLSMTQLGSIFILNAAERVVFGKEE